MSIPQPQDGKREPTLRERVAEVQRLRLAHAAAQAEVARLRAEWEQRHREAFVQANQCQVDLADAERILRRQALEEFASVGNKAPTPGVTIKIYTTWLYDPADAIAWAKEHAHPELLSESIDPKAFEALAKAMPLPFVHEYHEPRVSLAADLGKVIETEVTQDG